MAGQAAQCTGFGQLLQAAAIQVRAGDQVVQVTKRRLRTRRHDASGDIFAQATDQAHAQAQGRLSSRVIGPRFQRAVPVAVTHVDGPHVDAVLAHVCTSCGGGRSPSATN